MPSELLHTLPREHPLRNRPLKGAEHRFYCKHGEDICVPFEERGPGWAIWKWTQWGRLKPMKIERFSFNQLGPTWTDNREWRFPDE